MNGGEDWRIVLYYLLHHHQPSRRWMHTWARKLGLESKRWRINIHTLHHPMIQSPLAPLFRKQIRGQCWFDHRLLQGFGRTRWQLVSMFLSEFHHEGNRNLHKLELESKLPNGTTKIDFAVYIFYRNYYHPKIPALKRFKRSKYLPLRYPNNLPKLRRIIVLVICW